METTFALDWLSFTVKGIPDIDVCKALGFGQKYEAWTPVPGVHGYKLAKQHPFGHIVMSNPDRPEMGTHTMITGKALAALSQAGYETITLIPWCLKEGARISRMDLAIDVHEQPVDIRNLSTCEQTKGQEGSAVKWSLLTGSDNGVTLYIGSRKSEKFMRIYNKAAQMGLPGVQWTRFELELKADTARTIAAAIAVLPSGEIPRYVKGLMRALYNPANHEYQLLMDAPAISVASTKNASDSTVDWLLNSVAKTLARQIRLNPTRDIFEEFVRSVRHQAALLGMSTPYEDDNVDED